MARLLTLDVRHAQEKLWEVGRLFHREGSAELTRWVEELEELLYKGHVRALLRRLEQELRGVSPRGPGTKEKRGVLKQVIGYLEARVKLMDYGRLRKEDLVIATGVVEGAVRYVVGERLDNSGMRWIEERAEAVLLLRCIEVNGDWEAFMRWSQEQRNQELERGQAVQIRSKIPISTTRSRMNMPGLQPNGLHPIHFDQNLEVLAIHRGALFERPIARLTSGLFPAPTSAGRAPGGFCPLGFSESRPRRRMGASGQPPELGSSGQPMYRILAPHISENEL